MISLGTLIWSIAISLVVGAFGGYFVKDNYTKPDIQTNVDVDLTVKKNKLGNFRNRFKRKK